VLGILSGQQSLFTQHLTPQQQQMYQQHMQLQHQAQHLKKIRRSLPHSTSDQGQQIHQQVCVNRTTFIARDLNLNFFHTCYLCLSLCVPSFLRVAEGFLIRHTVFSRSPKSFCRFLPQLVISCMHFIQWGVLLLIVGTLCHNLSLCRILMHHYRCSCCKLFCIITVGFCCKV
jgi:hypothetical protein